MQFQFVLMDESTPASATPQYGGPLTPQMLADMAGAFEIQLNRDVAAAWGGAAKYRVGANPGDVAAGEVVAAIVDNLPGDASGAIAYHDADGNALPVIYAARTMCSSILSGTGSLSSAISHENCETFGDDDVNVWADDNASNSWAREFCDAVESNSYVINGIGVSDFLYPNFFRNGASGLYCYNQANQISNSAFPSAAFETAKGGYQVKRAQGTGDTDVWGKASMRAARIPRIEHWSSRVRKRLISHQHHRKLGHLFVS